MIIWRDVNEELPKTGDKIDVLVFKHDNWDRVTFFKNFDNKGPAFADGDYSYPESNSFKGRGGAYGGTITHWAYVHKPEENK